MFVHNFAEIVQKQTVPWRDMRLMTQNAEHGICGHGISLSRSGRTSWGMLLGMHLLLMRIYMSPGRISLAAVTFPVDSVTYGHRGQGSLTVQSILFIFVQ